MSNQKIRKAIIPVAGFGTRFLPATKAIPKEMLPIVDIPTIQYIIQEAVDAGIEEICLVTNSYKQCIENHFDKSFELEEKLKASKDLDHLEMVEKITNMANIVSVRQKNPRGLGHAIYCARNFVGDEPVAVLLGDDIVINENGQSAIQQLIDAYNKINASIVGVQNVDKKAVHKYGIIAPKKELNERLFEVSHFVEKPAQEQAPSTMAILGRYILTPEIFDILGDQQEGAGNEIQLTDALDKLSGTQPVYAYDFEGKRYDVGDRKGFLQAQVEFSLNREDTKKDMEEILRDLGYQKI